jgi:hypothetical protein
MQIRKKMMLLSAIGVMVAILILMGSFHVVPFINSTVKDAHQTIVFNNLKYQLKHLQEIATDTLAMGDEEGLQRLEKIKDEYLSDLKKAQEALPDFKKELDNFENDFPPFYEALKNMGTSGINRDFYFQKAADLMLVFDKSVEEMEKSLSKLDTKLNQKDLYKTLYFVKSTQEILTDAMAVFDEEGLIEAEKHYQRSSNFFKTLTRSLDARLYTKLQKDYTNLHNAGVTMVKAQIKGAFYNQEGRANMEKVDAVSSRYNDEICDITNQCEASFTNIEQGAAHQVILIEIGFFII